jgi:hypothetical protein
MEASAEMGRRPRSSGELRETGWLLRLAVTEPGTFDRRIHYAFPPWAQRMSVALQYARIALQSKVLGIGWPIRDWDTPRPVDGWDRVSMCQVLENPRVLAGTHIG